MTLSDDETLAEEVLEEPEDTPADVSAAPRTVPVQQTLESGMETGQGADDEPEIAIGDRHAGDALQVSPEEAKRLLGGENG